MRPSSYQVSAVHHVVLSLPNPRVKQQKCQSKRKQHKTFTYMWFHHEIQAGRNITQQSPSIRLANWLHKVSKHRTGEDKLHVMDLDTQSNRYCKTHTTFMWKCAVSRGLLSPHLSVMLMKLNSTNTTQPPHFLFFKKKKNSTTAPAHLCPPLPSITSITLRLAVYIKCEVKIASVCMRETINPHT